MGNFTPSTPQSLQSKKTMMRRAATRSALCRPSFAPTAARGYASVLDAGGKLGEREKAVEDRAIRNHDLELLKKLRDTLGIQENQPIPETVVTQVSSPSSSLNPFAQRAQSQQSSSSSHNDEPLTRGEFLEFRREIVQRLRNLEDDIMDLQTRRK